MGRGFRRLAAAVLAALLVLGALTPPSLASERKAVVELFTSQGCASCPPADVILRELSKRPDVVVLTLPVSYWDHLGWKDTLALDANNERQRAYAESRGDQEIYTPQVIVNGLAHVVGSHADEIDAAIIRTNTALDEQQVALSMANEDGTIVVRAAAAAGAQPRGGTIWVAFFAGAISVDIKDGENTGQNLTYTNVVRALSQAGHWNGEAASFRVPVPHYPGIDGCAAFLQDDQSKGMRGATLIPLAPR